MKKCKIVIIGYVEIKYQHITRDARGVAKFAIYDRMQTDTSIINRCDKMRDKFIKNLTKQGFKFEVLYHDGTENDIYY